MTGVQRLAKVISDSLKKEQTASKRGIIRDGMVCYGANKYAYSQAIDMNIQEGDVVWFQETSSGRALIIGA